MNEVFLVATEERRVVLRKHRRHEYPQVAFEHEVIRHAQSRGIPTPMAIPSRSGDIIAEQDGSYYSLFTFAAGEQVAREKLTAEHGRAMGEMAARLHLALADYTIAAPTQRPDRNDPGALIDKIGIVLERIDAVAQPTEQDGWAHQHLTSKAEWLRKHPLPTRPTTTAEDFQLLHGDFLHHNLFFADGQVSDVIDWDKARSRVPAHEIVRCFDHSFGARPEMCVAMLDGYRSIRPLSLDDLDRSAQYWFAQELGNLWVYEGIYLRGDDRLRVFLEPGPYVPFSDRWAAVRSELV